jgi:histidinol dehydrogenase
LLTGLRTQAASREGGNGSYTHQMIRRVDLRGSPASQSLDSGAVLPRAESDIETAVAVVRPICDDVRERGLAALMDYTRRFDGVELTEVRVPVNRIEQALADLEPDVRAGLEESIARLRKSCSAELDAETVTTIAAGGKVTRRLVPMRRVGLYVPGGLAPLVSSAVMNIVPAQVAGVPSLAVASPPQRDRQGLPHSTILAACGLLAVDEVYAVGGAQAIAMFAHGAGECRPVDLVTGPGNVYVVAAKRLLRGLVGIDSEAGPTEIAILADDTADAVLVAADLISQAEHDPLAAAVLVTPSTNLAGAVETSLDTQIAATKHAERIRRALAGRQSAIVLVDDLDQGQVVVEAYAAEHLELHTVDAADRARRIANAGAIFVGPYSPVSLGDYCAGSNHVLPTGRSARHSSGLSVRSFLKTVQVVEYDQPALAAVADHVVALAHAEDLPAHGSAVDARLEYK